MEDLTNVIYITEDTYSRMTGKRLSIDPQEIAFCRIITASYHIGDTPTSLTIGGEKYHIKEQLDYFPVDVSSGTVMPSPHQVLVVLVVPIFRICTASGSTSLPSTLSFATKPTMSFPAKSSVSFLKERVPLSPML